MVTNNLCASCLRNKVELSNGSPHMLIVDSMSNVKILHKKKDA